MRKRKKGARLAQFKDYSLLDKCRRSKDHKLLSREQFKEKEQKRSRKAARPKKRRDRDIELSLVTYTTDHTLSSP